MTNSNQETIDQTLEFKRAVNLKLEAAKDNVSVYFKRFDGAMTYRVNKTPYRTYQGALNHVKFLQSQLAPSTEARS